MQRELFMSYNVPDFIRGKVDFDNVTAIHLINDDCRKPMEVLEK